MFLFGHQRRAGPCLQGGCRGLGGAGCTQRPFAEGFVVAKKKKGNVRNMLPLSGSCTSWPEGQGNSSQATMVFGEKTPLFHLSLCMGPTSSTPGLTNYLPLTCYNGLNPAFPICSCTITSPKWQRGNKQEPLFTALLKQPQSSGYTARNLLLLVKRRQNRKSLPPTKQQ